MWKVQQAMEGERLILNLIGRLEGTQLQELQQLISSQAASREVVLDLDQLKLVDQEAVTFLSLCEAVSGIHPRMDRQREQREVNDGR
jgi:anti-anti-sigma regulatory factor